MLEISLKQILRFTNMPIFNIVHEYKNCEHRNEVKEWIMSRTKWTIPKNKRDPQNEHSKTQVHLNQNETK